MSEDRPERPMWVIGYVDAYGAVHARQISMHDTVYGCGSMHTNEERLSGRSFRWNVHEQEFGVVLTGCDRLDDDDRFRVLDYLDSGGHVDDLPGIIAHIQRFQAARLKRG